MAKTAEKEVEKREHYGHDFPGIDVNGNKDLKFRPGNSGARSATQSGAGSRYKGFQIQGSGLRNRGPGRQLSVSRCTICQIWVSPCRKVNATLIRKHRSWDEELAWAWSCCVGSMRK
jgi:hypothetical protein